MFQFSGNVYNLAMFAFHFSGVVIKQTRPGPIHRTLSPTLDISVLGGNQVSDPACTLNKNTLDVPDPVHEHLIKDGL